MFFAFEGVEGFGVGGEAVFVRNRVLEDEDFERHKGEQAVGTKEGKGAEAGEVLDEEACRREIEKGIENELTEGDRKVEGEDVDGENGLFSEGLIGVKNQGNDEDRNEQRNELGEEIIGVATVGGAVDEAPEENGGDGDFDMFPSAFIDSGEKPDEFVVMSKIVEKMGESADESDNN